MECFRSFGIDDLYELHRISQTTYLEAFSNLLNIEDVRAYVDGKYSLENLKKELQDSSNHFLFLEMDDAAIGYMKYSLKLNSLDIDRLYILRGFKGMGAGSKFMNKAEDISKSHGINLMTLGVLEMNSPAISFYEKNGFIQYSSETVSIGNSEYVLLLMKKDLK